jgi:hypothetical protein
MNAPLFCSGFGAYHSPNNVKEPLALLGISMDEIRAKLKAPQAVDKSRAQWAIFSTLRSRSHAEQRQRGEYHALWADIDETGGLTLADTFNRAVGALFCDVLAYTSRSATQDNQKCRLIVPLAEPVSGARYVAMAKILNARLRDAGLVPDIVTERTGQPCYLPNRGEFYAFEVEDVIGQLSPADWAQEIAEKEAAEKAEQVAREAAREAAKLKAQQRMASGETSPIAAFNGAYDLPLMLDSCGYLQKGDRWVSPNSSSGTPGVSLTKDGRKWLSAHGSDADIGKPTANGTMGDAFDLFVHYQHNGDRDAALKAAGAMFTTPEGLTITQANQREYMQAQAIEGAVADFDVLLNGNAPKEWPEIVPLDIKHPARLPVELWPPVLRDYATSAALETETPVELPAMLALGAVAAAVQRVLSVEIKPGYIEPCCLFTVIALPPAARKSAEFSRATRPLVQWEKRQREMVAEEIKQAESMVKTHKERCKELRKMAAKEADGEKVEQLAQELAELEAAEPQIPKAPRIWTSDVTTEHLATMMQDNGEALAVMSSEGGIFETMAGRYSQGVANIDLYLMGHAGDAVRVDRGSKPTVMLDDPRLSMALAVQPDVLASLSNKPGFKGRGLLGRVLFVLPPSTLGQRQGNTQRMDVFTQTNYEAAITHLIDIAHGDNRQPWTLELSRDAYTAWLAFWREVELELAAGGRFEHCRDWAGKLPGAVGRVAGLFHAVRDVDNSATRYIELNDMQAAIATGWALAEHALAAYGLMGADPDVEDAKVLLTWAQRKGLAKFTQRDAHRNHGSRWPKAGELLAGLGVLEERGYIRHRQQPSGEKGGRPTVFYEVNPAGVQM